jgi:hypothetical protein
MQRRHCSGGVGGIAMRIGVAAAAAVLLQLLWLGSALAADDPNPMTFTLWHSDAGLLFGEGSKDYIFADGDFVDDTADTFQKFLEQNPPKLPNTTVVLNSDGGNLQAGLALGRLIRKNKLWTQIGSLLPVNIGVSPTVPAKMAPYLRKPSSPPFPGYCYSSCTFAFLGGAFRFLDYGSDYGVHRFSFTNPQSGEDLSDDAQQMSGALVQYVVEMGVNAQFITQMSLKGPDDINHLTMQQLVALNVITPRWSTTWKINAFGDGSGFFLGGWTEDNWGLHQIAVSCAPPKPPTPATAGGAPSASAAPASGLPSSSGGGGTPAPPPVPAPPTPGLFLQFALELGGRGNADGLVKAVKQYVLELDDGSIVVPDSAVVQPATVATTSKHTRLAAKIRVSQKFADALEQSKHIGFAFLFDTAANLPLRLAQFEADLNTTLLKKFAATCH